MYNFITEVILGEAKQEDPKLEQLTLPYDRSDLDPVISEDTMNYHYGKLYKTYVDRVNSKEGDLEFNEAGAYLHHLYFAQFRSPKTGSKPIDAVNDLINEHFTDFDTFKDEVEKAAMAIQGSGWVYLSKNGTIKTIKHHAIRSEILLVIDWWEHSWALDYQADKGKYLKNIWQIIDWSVINTRLL